jgi:hypothetical protein
MGVNGTAKPQSKYVHPVAAQRMTVKVLWMLDYENSDKLSDELRLIIASCSSVTEAANMIARRIERS